MRSKFFEKNRQHLYLCLVPALTNDEHCQSEAKSIKVAKQSTRQKIKQSFIAVPP